MSPAALAVATVPLGLSLVDAARIFASIAALAAWIASDSRCAACSCAFVSKSACVLLDFTTESFPWLTSSEVRRFASCCTYALILFASFATVRRIAAVCFRAAATCSFALCTCAAIVLSAFATIPR